MYKIRLWSILFLACGQTINAQNAPISNAARTIDQAILLSEEALYLASFDQALDFVDQANFENLKDTEKLQLDIQAIRVRSFQSRLFYTTFQTERNRIQLLNYQHLTSYLTDKNVLAKYYTMLSALYRSSHPDSCIYYENKALQLVEENGDMKSLAELRATRISRELDALLKNNQKENAIALIPKFEEEIEFSEIHSSYAAAYNTRHLANIYRIYDLDQAKALSLYRQSLELREEIGFTPYIPASYYSVGEVNHSLGNYDAAIDAYYIAAGLADKINFVRYTILPYIRLGEIYATLGENETALVMYKKARRNAQDNGYTDSLVGELEGKIATFKE